MIIVLELPRRISSDLNSLWICDIILLSSKTSPDGFLLGEFHQGRAAFTLIL